MVINLLNRYLLFLNKEQYLFIDSEHIILDFLHYLEKRS